MICGLGQVNTGTKIASSNHKRNYYTKIRIISDSDIAHVVSLINFALRDFKTKQ